MRPRTHPNSRSAFTIVPLAVALWLVLLALGVILYMKTPPPGYVPSRNIGPGQLNSIYGAAIVGIFWIAVCGRIAERKSMFIANLTAGFVFGAACLGWSITLAGWTKDQRNLKPPAAIAAVQSPATPQPISSPSPSAPPLPPDGPEPAENPRAGPASPTTPAVATTPPPRPQVPPAPPPKPAFDAKPHIAAIEEPLLTSIDNVARQANKLLPTLSRRCPHEIRLVNERLAEIEALRTAAESLDKSLSTLQEDLEAKLIAAGSSGPDAHIISFRWAHEQFKDTPRHFGAQSLTRLCEKARTEHEFLRDNIAKWTIDSKGELKGKDTAFKQQADSNHFFVKAEADRRDSITNQLRGQ